MVNRIKQEHINKEGGRLASSVGATVHGTYYHAYLAIFCSVEDFELTNPDRLLSEIKRKTVPEERLLTAIRGIAPIHEQRHFHDCFGTFAGITLFFKNLERLRSFKKVCKKLCDDNLTIELPIQSWLEKPGCPDYFREFVANCEENFRRQTLFEGAFSLPPEFAVDERPWETFEIQETGEQFVASPLWWRAKETQDGLPVEQMDFTSWIPIGFNTLIEGQVQSLQKEFIKGILPDDVVEMFERAWDEHAIELSSDVDLDAAIHASHIVEPYDVTDIAVSKFLKSRNKRFYREELMGVTDAVLMHTPFIDELSQPGWRIGQTFTEFVESTWPFNDGEGYADLAPSVETIRDLRADILSFPKPNEISCDGPLESTLDYMESYVRHRIIGPLLAARIEHGSAVFYEIEQYATKIGEFPAAPVMINSSKFAAGAGLGAKFVAKWSEYVLMSQMLDEILGNRTVINCARAYPQGNLSMEGINMCFSGSCRENISARRCGTWDDRSSVSLPPCCFNLLTNLMRLTTCYET